MNFLKFKQAVAAQFERMSKHQLFRTNVTGDAVYNTYLESFPEGCNPLFRERTEHDCSACRSFIKAIGNVVTLIDGKPVSVWDVGTIADEPAYTIVAQKMAELVKAHKVVNTFFHTERTAGVDKNFEDLTEGLKTWNHFFVNIPRQYQSAGEDLPTKMAKPRETKEMLVRAISEIKKEAVDAVLDLIADNSLYRGEQHQFAVTEFSKLQRKARKDCNSPAELEVFCWQVATSDIAESVSRIRNTSIGTLLVDLSTDMDLEDAVRRYEAMVAPQNYKRPTALVSKAMIEKARTTIDELGLTSALKRRFARVSDLTINNLLFANREVKTTLAQDIFDELSAASVAFPKTLDRLEEVSIDRFMTEIVPRSRSIEVLFESRHIPNLVSLIAPEDPTAGPLFAWPNNFSWSYKGGVADSIKERVKQAGGNVTGDLCCRLAWHNHDDLDFHMFEPDGMHINFRDKRPRGTTGQLDVDMNAGQGTTREPVENIFYPDQRKMKEGVYQLEVHNFSKRESDNVGFEVEFDWLGDVKRFTYEKAVAHNERVAVLKFKFTKVNGVEILEVNNKLVGGAGGPGQEVWGIKTRDFHQVSAFMMSPNYWDDNAGVGNRHFMFMLQGCINDEPQVRGILNEFLRPDLTPHRKVMEIVGSKMKIEPDTNQLSGLGFSVTKHDSVVVRVHGAMTRMLKVAI